MRRQIDGMVVVITGASSGIGRALATELSQRGAKLVLSARRLERLQELNQKLGGRHFVVHADVSRPDDCARLVSESVDKLGRIDTLVCNAGYGLAKPVATTTAEELCQIVQTNVFGTTDTIRAALPVLERQDERAGWRGQIVIVSSAVARRGLPYAGAYSATKAAQLSIAESLRVELHAENIAVTTVHPVGTDTEFFDIAGKNGGRAVPPPGKGEIRQTSQAVALSMVKAIEHPRPEVWPLRSARWGLSIGTLFPSMVDRALRKYRKPVGR